MKLHAQGRFPLARILVLVECNGKFVKAVMQQNGRKRVDMTARQILRPQNPRQLVVKTGGTEKGMVHKVTEIVRTDGFSVDHIQQVALRKAVGFAQLLGNVKGEQLTCGFKPAVEQRFKAVFCRFIQTGQGFHRTVGEKQAALSPVMIVHLKIAEYLLKGKLKGIANVMKQRRKPPEFEEQIGGLMRRLQISFVGVNAVKRFERMADRLIRLIDGKAESKHIDGMGIVIPVLHQQRAPVGFVLREKLHHFLGFSVLAEEDLQIAVIYGVGVFRHAGIDKRLQRFFQTEAVDVHLHVVWDLARLQAFSEKFPALGFLLLLFRIKTELFAAVVEKAQCGGFQIVALAAVRIKRRLHRPHVHAEALFIFLAHFFQYGICHSCHTP